MRQNQLPKTKKKNHTFVSQKNPDKYETLERVPLRKAMSF